MPSYSRVTLRLTREDDLNLARLALDMRNGRGATDPFLTRTQVIRRALREAARAVGTQGQTEGAR